jgi:hypothetical protein
VIQEVLLFCEQSEDKILPLLSANLIMVQKVKMFNRIALGFMQHNGLFTLHIAETVVRGKIKGTVSRDGGCDKTMEW